MTGSKRRLSLLDASFLQLEGKHSPMHIAGLQLFTAPADSGRNFLPQLWQTLMAHQTPRYPFSHRLEDDGSALALPSLIPDEDFDFEYHVRHSALPKPGRYRELFELVSRLHGSPLDLQRPLWETHLIEGLPKRQFATYTKMHHALLDGSAGVRMLQASLSEDATRSGTPPVWSDQHVIARKREVLAQQAPAVSDALIAQLQAQRQVVPDLLKGLRRTLTSALFPRRSEALQVQYSAPRSILNGELSPQRRTVCQSWPQERLAAVARALDVTLNDVFLAMCAGALRHYLANLGALPDEPITACVPVAIASERVADGGNSLSTVIANLGTHLEQPQARLDCIVNSMRNAKAMLADMTPNGILAYTMVTGMPALLEQLLGVTGRLPPMYNLVISNVPGPKKPLYWNGAKLEHMYPISLLPAGQALNITLFSYAGSLEVSMVACRRQLPHMQRLIDHLEASLTELEQVTNL